MAPAKGQMHVVYQAMSALSMGMTTMVASVAMAYTSPALPSMEKDPNFTITKEDGSWIGSMVPAFAVIGSLAAGPLLDNIGRRAVQYYLVFPFVLSWAIIATAGNVKTVIVGRMLNGVCVGIQAVAGPILMTEIVQLNLRNKMAFFPGFLRNLGVTMGYIAGLYLTWRQLAWLGCLLCLPSSMLLITMPETPFFLTRSGKKQESIKALKQLRQTSQEAEKEQSYLDESCKNTKKAKSLMELFQPPSRWPVISGVALMLAQQTTGIYTVIFYASAIFAESGDAIDPNTASTILSTLDFLGSFIAIYFSSRYHRRKMIALSTCGVVLSLSVLSTFLWAQTAGGVLSDLTKAYAFIPVLALMVFKCSIASGWGPVPWIFVREGLPSSVRGQAASIIVTTSWLSAFLMTKTFQWSISILGLHYTFLSYAIASGINGSLIYRFMPESFGQSAEQMDKLYIGASKEKKK